MATVARVMKRKKKRMFVQGGKMEGKKVINMSYYLHGSFILLDYQLLVTDFQFVSTKQIGMTNSISMGLTTENSMFFSTVQKSVILWKILNL